jgi:uncharacterized protein YuzE
MEIRLDRDVNALYIRFRPGLVSRTMEITDSVYVDMDAEDDPIGIEFIDADEFVPFLRDHADDAQIPPRIREILRVTAA